MQQDIATELSEIFKNENIRSLTSLIRVGLTSYASYSDQFGTQKLIFSSGDAYHLSESDFYIKVEFVNGTSGYTRFVVQNKEFNLLIEKKLPTPRLATSIVASWILSTSDYIWYMIKSKTSISKILEVY